MAEPAPGGRASEDERRSHSVVRASVLSMVAIAALGLTRLVHGSLVSRATDQETYGRVGSLIALTTIASLLLPAGVASASSRFVPFQRGRGDDGAARGMYRFLMRLGLPGALAFGLGAGIAAAAWFDLGFAAAAEVVALAVGFSVYSIEKATLYGFERVSGYVRLELASSAVAVLATLLVLVAGWRTYLLPLALGYGVFAVGARLVLRGDLRGAAPPPAGPQRREAVRYVLLACAGTLASQGFLQGTQLLANAFGEPNEVAYFAAAVILVAPMYFLPRALSLALFPALARAHGAGDLDAVRRHADLYTRALFVVLAPVFAAGLLLAREVLVLFGGPSYAGGAPVLQLLLAATFLAVVAVAAVNTLSSGEHVHISVGAGVLGCLTGLGAVALLGPWLGATGVGLGYLAGTAVTAGIPVVTVWRRYGMPWRGPLLTAWGCVATALVLGLAIDGLDVSGGARVVLDVVTATAVAGLAAAVLQGHIRQTVRAARAPSHGP